MQLSLCVIARNEAAFLEQCLQSVQGLADEIVLVDTGSTDDTPAVAQRHAARVLACDWTDDFSAARNRSLQEAQAAWILVLDCDEVIARRDHAAIRSAMALDDLSAFRLTTRNYIDGAHWASWQPCRGEYAEEKHYPGWFETTKIRLWRRHDAVRFEGALHELVEPAVRRNGGRIGTCAVPVHHYGYVEKQRPLDLYVRAGEKKTQASPRDSRAWYELAIACRDAARLPQALHSIDNAIQFSTSAAGRPGSGGEDIRLVRADILTHLERLDDALAEYEEILKRWPRSHLAWNNKGRVLERLGKAKEAQRCYTEGLRLAPDNPVLAANVARLRAPETS